MGRPRVADHATRPPLRHAQLAADVRHRLPASGLAQKFPEGTSLRIAWSSAWSATSFFSWVFSRSRAFSRLAWSSRKPPYSFRHREYVYSLIPSVLQTCGVRRPRPTSTAACRSFVRSYSSQLNSFPTRAYASQARRARGSASHADPSGHWDGTDRERPRERTDRPRSHTGRQTPLSAHRQAKVDAQGAASQPRRALQATARSRRQAGAGA